MVVNLANSLIEQRQSIEPFPKAANPSIFDAKDPRISTFGSTGYIGSRFCDFYANDVIKILRDDYEPKSKNILYLISTTHNRNIFTNPHLDIDTNLNVLIDVLEKCKDKDIIFNFVSTSLVYGDCELPAAENTFCNPKGFYGITKKCAEDLLISYCLTFHIPYRILRLSTVYGKSNVKEWAERNALHLLIEKLKRDEPIKLYFHGEFIRDYIHLDDVVRAIDLVVEQAPLNSIINIGSGMPYQFIDLIEKAKAILGSQSVIETCPPSEFYTIAQTKDLFLDIGELKSLGFEPAIAIESGIAELCN
ncbi:MAG: SDR family oxidoreductase [Leptolyngbyaceae cyanobacterium CRU_2_3]|nr:SDR family oxidoreductase [Leptolyngbyaceae cyanobacterium CRU_2_3]